MWGLAKNAFCILRCDEVHINGLRCRPRRQDLRQEGRTKMSDAPATAAETRPAAEKTDVVVVGAGFAGLYMLHRLRGLGVRAGGVGGGDDVGGTWYWNRYPGARVDVECVNYSFSFSSELEQDSRWAERYAPQPEILKDASHVADRFA